jgi:hypothetical protein
LEGADYAFVFYGGKVLSHFGFELDDSAYTDLVSMLPVSRYSAVLMDRDLPNDEPLTSLRETKAKILREAEKDKIHRLCCVTVGREVENDLPPAVLKRAAEARIDVPANSLNALALTSKDRYFDEIVHFLRLDDGRAKKAKRKLADKVGLATAILKLIEEQEQPLKPWPEYVERLYDFVIKSRVV